jgi:hypothetical protein
VDPIARLASPRALCYLFPVFHAMIHIFECATLRTLRPSFRANKGVFPAEIYQQTLTNIDDPSTYNNCAKVSRFFHNYCHQNVRMGVNGVVTRYDGLGGCRMLWRRLQLKDGMLLLGYLVG